MPKNDDRDPLQTRLKLIGLVRTEDDVLVSRNRIYKRFFDGKWISENMPSPPERTQHVIWGLVAIIMFLLGVIFVPLIFNWRVSWNPNFIQAETFKENILDAHSPTEQLINLYRLIDTGYEDIALTTFVNELQLSDQITLFAKADVKEVGANTFDSVAEFIFTSGKTPREVKLTILASLLKQHQDDKFNRLFLEDMSESEQEELFQGINVETVDSQIVMILTQLTNSGRRGLAIQLLNEMPLKDQVALFVDIKGDIRVLGDGIISVFETFAYSSETDKEVVVALFTSLLKTDEFSDLAMDIFRRILPQRKPELLEPADFESLTAENYLEFVHLLSSHLHNTADNNRLLKEISRP